MITRPAINQDNAYFWEGVEQNALRIQRCTPCGTLRHPPSPTCPKCFSFDWEAVDASGRGQVFTHATVHHPLTPPYDKPYVLAVIELEEGVRMLTRLLDNHTDDRLCIGAPAHVEFVDVDGLRLPLFRLSA